MRKSFISVLFVFAILFCLSEQAYSLSVAVPDKIRVAIAEDAEEIELAVKGPYKITTIETGEVLKEGEVLWQAKVRPFEHGIHFRTFKDDYFKIYGIEIIPARDPSIYVGKCLYRGRLQLIKTKQGLLSVINVLNIEDYIKGVLYNEISHRWPPEVIKAQAIASRTFAIYQAQQRSDKEYYLRADVSSQVYRGVFGEKFRTSKAVDETAGQILMYRGKVLPAFFHAACGGRTEKASRLWKISSRLKPLKGVNCPFCRNSPYFMWVKTVPLEDIESKIAIGRKRAGKIKHIKVLSRDRSGRLKKLKIYADRIISMDAKEFRNILGARVLNSTNFSISIEDNQAHFKGYGWGHGVGMCQWGAFSMAKKGYNCYQILRHYYPGAKVVRLK
ncbi:MAG: SpoIID/LytB domain-containing protein [Candidatus Omnitrophota bacterium]|nr:MAG: SpoIID/LytB domain-containing protein [Candidatus Omnitrophota bacterium]